MRRAFSIEVFATEHPRVKNEQENDGLVRIKGLRYLLESGQTGEQLLLDILEGGRGGSVSRFRLTTALDQAFATHERLRLTTTLDQALTTYEPGEISEEAESPAASLLVDTTATADIVPRERKVTTYHNPRALPDRAIWKGCDVDAIPIPGAVSIGKDLEPHITQLEAMWMLWLYLDTRRRVLKFRSKEKEIRHYVDDMVSDRHRQEFRFIFLKYIECCLSNDQSEDFMDFHMDYYEYRTDLCREESERVAMLLNDTLFYYEEALEEGLEY
ncbi:hypothetical protein F4782DRAFT_528870 [Xylaria castorea]|nr:hypothetical protein F4782DRAFT_528870 [Xylaria castorea]